MIRWSSEHTLGIFLAACATVPMTQLTFPFLGLVPEHAVSRSAYRKRLARVAGQAYRLGQLRAAGKRRIAPHSLGAAAAPPVRAAYVDKGDRNELHELAARVARLTIDRHRPEWFFVEKDEISAALRAIARRV